VVNRTAETAVSARIRGGNDTILIRHEVLKVRIIDHLAADGGKLVENAIDTSETGFVKKLGGCPDPV
jgi:hypothetical protein